MNQDSLFKRVYKIKNPVTNFLCPLCSSERGLKYKSKLSALNYLHIFMLCIVSSLVLWGLMEFKVVYTWFIIWALYEGIHKMLFRKEIPCPHCGFDATWYKRDVRVARKKVAAFWEAKQDETNNADEQKPVSTPDPFQVPSQHYETDINPYT